MLTSMRQVFSGAHLVVDDRLRRGDLVVDDGLIVEISFDVADTARTSGSVDCGGLVLSPGFVDLQCNGAFGADITTDPMSIEMIAEALPRFGVTSFHCSRSLAATCVAVTVRFKGRTDFV